MERLVDTAAAAEMGIDPVELRRRNHIPPDEMPYKAPTGTTYDSGDFTELLDNAVALADWAGYEARKAESRARGKLRGRGIGDYLELTGAGARDGRHPLRAERRRDASSPARSITARATRRRSRRCSPAGSASRSGASASLQGDSDELIAGGGTGGSKSMMASGTAIVEASDKVIEAGRQIAAHVLEAAVADIEFRGGRFVIAGTDRAVGLMELAGARSTPGSNCRRTLPQSLDVGTSQKVPPSAFPNGCHIAEVEVDPDTGTVEVVKYTFVNDFGAGHQPAPGRRPGAWRHRPGHRPGALRADRL